MRRCGLFSNRNKTVQQCLRARCTTFWPWGIHPISTACTPLCIHTSLSKHSYLSTSQPILSHLYFCICALSFSFSMLLSARNLHGNPWNPVITCKMYTQKSQKPGYDIFSPWAGLMIWAIKSNWQHPIDFGHAEGATQRNMWLLSWTLYDFVFKEKQT